MARGGGRPLLQAVDEQARDIELRERDHRGQTGRSGADDHHGCRRRAHQRASGAQTRYSRLWATVRPSLVRARTRSTTRLPAGRARVDEHEAGRRRRTRPPDLRLDRTASHRLREEPRARAGRRRPLQHAAALLDAGVPPAANAAVLTVAVIAVVPASVSRPGPCSDTAHHRGRSRSSCRAQWSFWLTNDERARRRSARLAGRAARRGRRSQRPRRRGAASARSRSAPHGRRNSAGAAPCSASSASRRYALTRRSDARSTRSGTSCVVW